MNLNCPLVREADELTATATSASQPSASQPSDGPAPPLTADEYKVEEALAGQTHPIYRNIAWHLRTRIFALEWDRQRRKRLGRLGTYFKTFTHLWDLPDWLHFNAGRREADAFKADYSKWISAQFDRVLGMGKVDVLPGELHGTEAAMVYHELTPPPMDDRIIL